MKKLYFKFVHKIQIAFQYISRKLFKTQASTTGRILHPSPQNFSKLLRAGQSHFSWKSPKFIAVLSIVMIAATGAGVYLNQTTDATYVIVNGQQLGLVKDAASGKKLVEAILEKRGKPVGEIASTHDQIDYKNARVKKAVLVRQGIDEQELDNALTTYVNGYSLAINGTNIAILLKKEDADKVLKKYKDYFVKPSGSNIVKSAKFAEKVDEQPQEVQPEQILSPDKVYNMLIEGKSTVAEYVVQPNDSWWLIARKNNMKTKEVLAGNPGTTEDTVLQPGQKIKLASVVPYLTVVSAGEFTGPQTIPFDVVTKTDYNLSSGQSRVIQQGSDGQKIVTYDYVQQNGVDIEKKIVQAKVVTQPVTQIVARGPNRTPISLAYNVSRGSGHISGLIWPIQGAINSPYGYRSGGFHTGIDIAGDTGEPYVAAASGTVVAAGWDGGYGNMILIDHGNGVLTRYAHSTKLLVRVGQHVNQGQPIGWVGSTGNATGPHLHFEIIANGDTVNPLNYLP